MVFPQPAVYMRWFQFGCFSPLMRPHGTAPRDPWYFGEAAVTNYKFLAWTRENFLNYTYNAAAIAHADGHFHHAFHAGGFPDRTANRRRPGSIHVRAGFAGCAGGQRRYFRTFVSLRRLDELVGWQNSFRTTKRKVDAPLDTIPVYLKPGAVVPVELNEELQFGESMTSSRVHAMVVTRQWRWECNHAQ